MKTWTGQGIGLLLGLSCAVGAAQAQGGSRSKSQSKPQSKPQPMITLTIHAQVTGRYLRNYDQPADEAGESKTEVLNDQLAIRLDGTYRARLGQHTFLGGETPGGFTGSLIPKPSINDFLRFSGGGIGSLKERSTLRGLCKGNPATFHADTDATCTHTVRGETCASAAFDLGTKEYSVIVPASSTGIVTTQGHTTTNEHGCQPNRTEADWTVDEALTICNQTLSGVSDNGVIQSGKANKSNLAQGGITGVLKPDKNGSFRVSGCVTYLYHPPDTGGKNSKESSQGNLVLNYTLAYDTEPPDVEAVIEPGDDYKTWQPEGGADEKTAANEIAFHVRLQPRDKATKSTLPTAKFHCDLLDTSKEKGVCLNFPARDKATATPDLKIDAAAAGLTVAADGQSADSKSGLKECDVVIKSYDWGAHARLKVTATLDSGKQIEAYLAKQPGVVEVSAPLDANHNHVADGWESDLSRDAQWDEDAQPAEQRRNGDGYTLYEEYRGFMQLVNGDTKHVRTDPDHKDLFVYDPDNIVKEYYEPTNPAQLHLHYIDPGLMVFNSEARNPDNRWVNFNASEETTYARQYALYVKQWTIMGGTTGEGSSSLNDRDTLTNAAAHPASSLKDHDHENGLDTVQGSDPFKQPLKDTYIVKISRANRERQIRGKPGTPSNAALAQQIFAKEMPYVVCHEIGHAIGIKHHSHVLVPDIPQDTPDEVRKKKEEAASESATTNGVLDCLMRYRKPIEFQHILTAPTMSRFCRRGETARESVMGTDDDGNQTVKTEEIPSDECWNQIDVKCDP